MNRKHHTNGGQNQGWVALENQQLAQIEGGVDQFSFNYSKIEFENKPSASVREPAARLACSNNLK